MTRSVTKLRWVVGCLAVITACSTTEPIGLADSDVNAGGTSETTQPVTDDSGAAGTSANADGNSADSTTPTTAAAGAANPVESSGPDLILDDAATTPETWSNSTSLAEFRNLVVDLHGPTDDLPGDFRRLIPFFPADVPTPPGAEIVGFNIRLQSRGQVRSEVTVGSSATGDDLVTLFTTQLDGAGYEESGTANQDEDGLHIEQVTYDLPLLVSDDQFATHTIEVTVITGDELARPLVEILQVADIEDVSQLSDLAAIWHRDTPVLPSDATLQSATIQTTLPFVFSDPRLDLTYSDFWEVEQGLGQEIAVTLRDDAKALGVVPDPATKYGPDGALQEEFDAGTDFVLMKFIHPRFSDYGLSLNTDEGPEDLLIGTQATMNLAAPAQ